MRLESAGAVARLTLGRPQALNALDVPLLEEFARALDLVRKSPAKVLVITGAGGAFSAGGDLGFLEDSIGSPKARLRPRMRWFYDSVLRLRTLPQATIAQVNGAAVGAGLCLALACDLRTALADARCALNFVKLGLSPGMGAWPLARAAFGDARARDLLFTGRFFTGLDLHAWGACSETAESPAELEKLTAALAAKVASGSRVALRKLKEETLLSEPLERFLAFEAAAQTHSFHEKDIQEGLAAVRERRAPRFA